MRIFGKAAALVLMLILVSGCGKKESVVVTGPDRIPFSIVDDFETNELFAWECYPYAQDIGYDPFILCQKEPTHNGSRYALARIVKPNDALDLSEGFTKEIDLWTAPGTTMKLALFLVSDRKPESVTLSLGLFDGRLFTYTLKAPDVNRWLELSVPASSFTANGAKLGAGEHVQVVAIKAFYPLVTHLASYTILLDDFTLNGERTRQFESVQPASTYLENFGIALLNGHYFFGDALKTAVTPEGGKKLIAVECTLLDPAGKPVAADVALFDDGSHGDTKAGDNVWSNDALHTFAETDPRGQWTMSFSGRSESGPDVEWSIRFLMPGKRLTSADHPRLYFYADELKARMASNESPTAKRILERAVNRPWDVKSERIDEINEDQNLISESLTGGPYSQANDSVGRWRRPQALLGRIVEDGAWRYAFTGDTEAGTIAKKAMLKLVAFKYWNSPWMESHGRHFYYPVGYTTKQIAIGYDFLYPLMNDGERKTVRDALIEKGIKPCYRDMVEMDRMPSSLSNHIAVITSGVEMAAVAVYGDDPGNPSMEPYFSGILTKMKTFIDRTYKPEGSYGEPYTYQAMASRDLTETLFALERNFGIDYTTTTDLKDLWVYPLYATHVSGRYPDFGDVSLTYGMAQTHFLWLTYRMKNPWTYAYAKPYFEAGNGGWLGYLWYTDGIEPRYRTELPTSKFFTDKGNMVMRSDWDNDGSIIIFKCGANSNHYHLDQGTFAIMTNGDELLSDAGHSNGYYTNLYYPCYYTQAIGHNVMLVDMNPESQSTADYENGIAALRDYPRMIHAFASNAIDEAEGDLTCVYKGAVSKYTRSLMYMKPGPLFLFDRVEANEGHEYNWLFHAEHSDGKNAITYNDGRMTITHPEAHLTMDVLAPEIASHTIRNSDRDESFIALSSKPGLKKTAFLSVLMPESGKGMLSSMKSRLIEDNGFIGGRVEHGNAVDFAFFSADGSEVKSSVEGFEASAERFAVAQDKTGRTARFLVRGTKLTALGSSPVKFSSSIPVTVTVSYELGRTIIDVDAPKAAEITLSTPGSPYQITAGGEPFDAWSYDNASKTATFRLPEGRTNLIVR